MLLPLTYESSDLTKTDRGTITLKSTHNGERFVGKIALYDTYEDSINTANVMWFRSKTDLENYIADIEKKRDEIKELRKQAREIDKKLKVVEGVTPQPPNDSSPSEVKTKPDNNEQQG